MAYKIYTCGKMSGISYKEQMRWRKDIDRLIRNRYNGNEIIKFIHPPVYFNYDEKNHNSEKEILDWEMAQLHDSDLAIVNLNQIETSVGTNMELGAIQGINRFGDKYIYTVGLGDSSNIHPWIKETCNRIENDISNLADYIIEYLLI